MLDLLDAELPTPARGVFTTRAGGVSAGPWLGLNLSVKVDDQFSRVDTNRQLLERLVGSPLVLAQQVHGSGVRLVETPSNSSRQAGIRGVDALVTTRRGLRLTVLGADCLPVLLADPVANVIAAAHVGRGGLARGVLAETLRVMAEQGADPARTAASLGPAVCGGCYEVPEALAEDVGAAVPGSRSTTRQGTPSLDLTAGATRQLLTAGLTDIRPVGGCTLEQPERFYSYRRDGVTGRHAGVVWLP